jgi:hypothetical protein
MSLFLVLYHVIIVDIVFTKQILISTSFVVLVLNFYVKIYEDDFFNGMFSLSFQSF